MKRLLPLLVGLLAACGGPASINATSEPTTAVVALDRITAPAAVTVEAVRATTAPIVEVEPPTFDPVAYCNGLDYAFNDLGPAMECFRVAALSFGISQTGIDEGWAWIFDVIAKESGGCPFAIGGDRNFTDPTSCFHTVQGTGTDTGFGQATDSYWGRNGKLCTLYGVCHPEQILASPYDSMVYSVIVPAMLDGRYGYCDYEGAPRYHNCGLVSKAWRLA